MKPRYIEITLEELIERSGFVFIVKKSDVPTSSVDIAVRGDKSYIPPYRKTLFHFDIVEELYPKSDVSLIERKASILEAYYKDKYTFHLMSSAGQRNKLPVYDRYKILIVELDMQRTKIVFLRYNPQEHCFQFVVEGAQEFMSEKERIIKWINNKLEKQDTNIKARIINVNLHINSLYYLNKIDTIKEIPLPDEWYTSDKKKKISRWKIFFNKLFSKRIVVKSKNEIMQEFSEKYKDEDFFKHAVQFNSQDKCDKCSYNAAAWCATIVSLKNNTSISMTGRDLHNIRGHQGRFTDFQFELLEKLRNN